MKRRDLLTGAGPFVLAGCLRLNQNDDDPVPGSDGDEGAEEGDSYGQNIDSDDAGDGSGNGGSAADDRDDGFSLEASVDRLPEFLPGLPEDVPFTVENRGEGPFEGEILLLLDRELEAVTNVDIRSHTAVSVEFPVTIDGLAGRTVELEARTAEYREVLLETSITPVWEPLVFDWRDSYVPADDPDAPEEVVEDDRYLSYGCNEMVVESEDEVLEVYDVGVEGEEPNFLEGAYARVDESDHDDSHRGTFRFFGGDAGRTVITFDEGDLSAATRIRLTGFVPGMDAVEVDVYVGEVQVDHLVFEDAPEPTTHVVPLPDA